LIIINQSTPVELARTVTQFGAKNVSGFYTDAVSKADMGCGKAMLRTMRVPIRA
jgi:hypothetical protein